MSSNRSSVQPANRTPSRRKVRPASASTSQATSVSKRRKPKTQMTDPSLVEVENKKKQEISDKETSEQALEDNQESKPNQLSNELNNDTSLFLKSSGIITVCMNRNFYIHDHLNHFIV